MQHNPIPQIPRGISPLPTEIIAVDQSGQEEVDDSVRVCDEEKQVMYPC